MKWERRKGKRCSFWGVIKHEPHREFALWGERGTKIGPYMLVQRGPRDLCTLASANNMGKDEAILARFGWMPFKLAVAKLRLLT